jgi:hypothetical protein
MIDSLDKKTKAETINKLRKLLLLPSITNFMYITYNKRN